MDLSPFSTSILQMPAISSSASTARHVSLRGPWGSKLRGTHSSKETEVPEGEHGRKWCILLSVKDDFKEWMGIKTPQHRVLQAQKHPTHNVLHTNGMKGS